MLGDAPRFCKKHWHQQPKTSKHGRSLHINTPDLSKIGNNVEVFKT